MATSAQVTENTGAHIKEFLQNRYDQATQQLSLCWIFANLDARADDWATVLSSADWTALKTLQLGMMFSSLGRCRIDDSNAGVLSNFELPNLEELQISKT